MPAQARARAAAEADYSPSPEAEAVQPNEDDDDYDDRLYCSCKQLYDPERMMIACDRCVLARCSPYGSWHVKLKYTSNRCDEWYHLDVRALTLLSPRRS
jgi:hypothetical protein